MVNSSETRNLEGCHSREGLVLLQLLSRGLFSPAPCSLALSACKEPLQACRLLCSGRQPQPHPQCCSDGDATSQGHEHFWLDLPKHMCLPTPASLSTGEIALDNKLPRGFPSLGEGEWWGWGGGAGVGMRWLIIEKPFGYLKRFLFRFLTNFLSRFLPDNLVYPNSLRKMMAAPRSSDCILYKRT